MWRGWKTAATVTVPTRPTTAVDQGRAWNQRRPREGSFSVLAGSTVTNTGPTTLGGSVGVHPGTAITGASTLTVGGETHAADAVALQAKTDLTTAYNDAAG